MYSTFLPQGYSLDCTFVQYMFAIMLIMRLLLYSKCLPLGCSLDCPYVQHMFTVGLFTIDCTFKQYMLAIRLFLDCTFVQYMFATRLFTRLYSRLSLTQLCITQYYRLSRLDGPVPVFSPIYYCNSTTFILTTAKSINLITRYEKLVPLINFSVFYNA